ncbi:PEGA domain-containing protein [Candidatus Bathyarchaeota archaeon]|nr:PEGA domain-containing protein [Candidatus Bathyarchaeota archaeon]
MVGRGISNITLGPETALKNPIPGDPPIVDHTQHGYFDNTVGWINGTVTDASTGNPIEDATVTADGYSTTTNINGEYIIPADLAPGTYRVEASKPGYISSSKFAEVFGEETTTVDFALTPLPPGKGAIAGTITDALTGDPIEGATVTADGYSTTTDADGYYNITIDPGTYTVTTSATGYESDSKSTTVDAGETTTVNFTLQVIINITISADPVTITVGESTTLSVSISPPLEGLNITIQYKLSDEETWTNLTTVITDENGRRSHDWTPETAGTYEVKAIWLGDENVSTAESDVQPITVEETPTPGIPWYIYMAAAAVVAIVMVAIAFYFLRIRKPKPT